MYSESASLMESRDVAFDIHDGSNLVYSMPAFGIEDTVTRACLRYTRGYWTPDIESLINSGAMK